MANLITFIPASESLIANYNKTTGDCFLEMGTPGTFGVGLGAEATSKVGFFGVTPRVQPTVPLTSPDVQDVIDALVALGLVKQSD